MEDAQTAVGPVLVGVVEGPDGDESRPHLGAALVGKLAGHHLGGPAMKWHRRLRGGDEVARPGGMVGAAEVRADHIPAAVGGQAGQRGVARFTGTTTGGSQDQARNKQPADDKPAAGEPVQGAIQRRHNQWGHLSEYRCGRHPLRRPADKPVDVEQCHVRRLRDTAGTVPQGGLVVTTNWASPMH